MDTDAQPTPIVRATQGRWLGGVCRGLGDARGVSVGRLRFAVLALTLCGGLGAVLYLAAWLILPGAGAEADQTPGTRPVVLLVKALAAICGLLVLAALGAAATVFGYGWIVLGVAAATLLGVMTVSRLGPAWALLPVAALTVPAAALAADGVQLAPTGGAAIVQVPLASLNGSHGPTYRSGLGTLMLDLRHTRLPRDRPLVLRIHAGIRRTIVALPSDECVNVVVHHHINPFAVRAATLLTGRGDHAFADVFMFGRLEGTFPEPVSNSRLTPERRGAMLTVDFASEGGSLYVRDYPNSVDPDFNPNWPGIPSLPQPRPLTRGWPKRAATRAIHAWRAERREAAAANRRYRSLVGGPCALRRSPAQHVRHAAPAAHHPSTAHHSTRARHPAARHPATGHATTHGATRHTTGHHR